MADEGDVRVKLLKPLRRILRRGHPWVYRDALARVEVRPGTVVTVVDDRDRYVARGWADEGPIAVRVLTIRDEPVDDELLRRRVADAVALRERLLPPDSNTFRLIHGEGDRLPGIVVDIYGEYASMRLDGTAAVNWRERIVAALQPHLQRRGIRGLVGRSGRRGKQKVSVQWGEAPPDELHVRENGVVICVDVTRGQKTGMFIDHRLSRARVRNMSKGLRVLDLYSYIGGFSAAAGLGGALAVTTVDASEPALDFARRAWTANGLSRENQVCVVADVPTFLEEQTRAKQRFDLVIADPPSFAPNRAAKPAALKAYTKLHETCIGLLAPGGFYMAASCSSHVDRRDFNETLVEGADRARRNLQVLERWGAPPDHPRLLSFPEGDYLKVMLAKAQD